MDAAGTVLLAFSMSVDAFAAALAKGAAQQRPPLRDILRTGAIFGLVEAATPLLGWALGFVASQYLAMVGTWLAFAMLLAVGLRMVLEGLRRDQAAPKPERHGLGVLLMTALGTSMDALAVGISLALLRTDILAAAGAIGLASFAMASVGVMLGHHAGRRLGRAAEIAGGVGVVLIGLEILRGQLI